MRRYVLSALCVFACAVSSSAALPLGVAAQFKDQLSQAPSVARPQAASLAGAYSATAFGPGELSRGQFSLPSPFAFPTERGPLLAPVVPGYSADGGISEWGMGWTASFSLRRFRETGDLNYTDDLWTSPWGVLRPGDDGAFYPTGFTTRMRVRAQGEDMMAVDPAGTRYLFLREDAVSTDRGVFEYMLSSVETVVGERTELHYERNESGRPFLSSIEYGGRGARRQVELRFVYEPLSRTHVDYRSGTPLALDRRVVRVEVRARSRRSGAYEPRYHYRLSHDAVKGSPAFYLTRVEQEFSSGAVAPAFEYSYDVDLEPLTYARPTRMASVEPFLKKAGLVALKPRYVAYLDADDDGRTDLEHHYKHTLVRQTDAGLKVERLDVAGDANPFCRPDPSSANTPRQFARLIGGRADSQVVRSHAVSWPDRQFTDLYVCERNGTLIQRLRLDGFWDLQASTTRLVDVDRDERPDLIRVFTGGYEYRRNISEDGRVAFAPPVMRKLLLDYGNDGGPEPIVADAMWTQDMNGDGLLDMVQLDSGGFAVWHGIGDFRFESRGQKMRLAMHPAWNNIGNEPFLGEAEKWAPMFIDANRDGRADVLLTREDNAHLFLNNGRHFQQVDLSFLRQFGFASAYATAIDIIGTGETQIVWVQDYYNKTSRLFEPRAYHLTLTRPSMGLMTSADDGRGTRLSFSYERAPAEEGIGHRPSVLAELTVESSGYDAVTYQYTYEGAVTHSVTRALLGFGTVTKVSPLTTEQVSFLHEDAIPSTVLGSEQHDTRSSYVKFTVNSPVMQSLEGVAYRRLEASVSGLRSKDGSASHEARTTLSAFERGFCPTVTVTEGASGVLTKRVTLDAPTALSDAMHCLTRAESLSGKHGRAALDFSHVATTVRNAIGQPLSVTATNGNETVALQTLRYDASQRLIAIEVPGQGATTVSYENETDQVLSVTTADGVVTERLQAEDVSDVVTSLGVQRGAGRFISEYRYDDRERLEASWDNVSGTSAASPLTSIAYRDVTHAAPGLVFSSMWMGGHMGSTKSSAQYVSADGESLAQGLLTANEAGEEILALSGVTQTSRNSATKRTFDRAPVATHTVAPMNIGYAELFDDTTELSSIVATGFGEQERSAALVQAGVQQSTFTARRLHDEGLLTTITENDEFIRRSMQTVEGRPLWQEDELGYRTSFTHDALGRLVEVVLPDGASHRVTYDGAGRLASVERAGLQTIEYRYAPGTSLLKEKLISDASGELQRSILFTHDSVGRVVEELHTDELSGDSDFVLYEYDGRVDGARRRGDQVGRLTAVTGEGFQRRLTYDGADRLIHVETELEAFRTVVEENAYYADGTLQAQVVTILDPEGHELQTLTQAWAFDQYGRAHSYLVNGHEVLAYGYDERGRPAFAQSALNSVHFAYDQVTQRINGYTQVSGDRVADVRWDFNKRGHIVSERYGFDEKPTIERAYTYEARGYLERSASQESTESYGYNAAGLINHISDAEGERDFVRGTGVMLAGETEYEYDALGRVSRRDQTYFEYGPRGQLARATRGEDRFEYIYDHADQRLLKKKNGVAVAAYLGDAYLDAERFVVPVKVSGRLIGMLVNGEYQHLDTDLRNTVIRQDGEHRLATPYGDRAERLALSEAFDYAEKGYDPDLGTVRMGVRDYDPKLGQFWTADPLFLERLDMCAKSTVDCNLYGYAKNDPVKYTDPTGLCPTCEIQAWLEALGYDSVEQANEVETVEEFAQGAGDGFVEGATAGVVPAEEPETWMEMAGQVVGNVYGQMVQDAAAGTLAKLGARALRFLGVAPEAASATGTVWDAVKATQPAYRGTAIPRSFELRTDAASVWVHGNATEHLAEYAVAMLNRGVARDLVNLASQQQIRSLQAAVGAATEAGVPYGKIVNVGGWELKFARPRAEGQLPALIHALQK